MRAFVLSLLLLLGSIGPVADGRISHGGAPASAGSSGPFIRQVATYTGSAAGSNSPWTATLTGVLAGDSIYVVGYWPNFASTYPTMGVSDGSGTYTQLDRLDDTETKVVGGSFAGIGGTQSMGHWVLQNVSAGTHVVAMAPNPNTFEDWAGVVAIEVANVHAVSENGHNIANEVNAAAGANDIQISITNSAQPALLVAVTATTMDYTAPTGPTAGTGMTQQQQIWPFVSPPGNPAGLVAYSSSLVTTTGTPVTVDLTPNEPTASGTTPNYLTAVAAFE
jgi:hypothetical protein